MIINSENANRLAIYFFYDKRGIVDRYVPYFLDDLKKNVSEIFIVCNGKLTPDGKEQLEKYGHVMVRENKGFDVWAYKTALDQYGWDRLAGFDEVVMTNSTLMGPVRPLQEMFDAMAQNPELDFWGLTIHHGAQGNPFQAGFGEAAVQLPWWPNLPKKKELPALIIIDAGDLEKRNGLNLCYKLKQHKDFQNSKIIVTSIIHDKELVLNAGADLYLPKPYEISNLIKWVDLFIKEFNQ